MQHPVIGVLGASGGLGTSTLAVALAARASPLVGLVACVDADFGGGGLDVTACVEHLPGLRWPDLASARGELDGAALLQGLPRERSVAVLGSRGQRPAGAVVEAALGGLRGVCALTVVDLGRSPELGSACTSLVLVGGTSARQLADLDAVTRHLSVGVSTAAITAVLALRREPGVRVAPEEIAGRLDLPLGAVVQPDPRVARDAERARMPGADRSSLAASAEALLLPLDLGGQRGR